MSTGIKIGFLGAGKMATALAQGFVKGGILTPADLYASDPFEEARANFTQLTQAGTTQSNVEIANFAEVLLIAVKPNQVQEVLAGINPALKKEHLVISIAAGVPLNTLQSRLPSGLRVVRVMPNTPALVGACAAAFARGQFATVQDAQLVGQLFSAVGIVCEVKEELLDAVTGLSGSGPAYVCAMIEALSDGGVAAGLSRDVSTRLAAQTLLGTAKMVLETGLHPGVLKDMVTSPGGTTIEGIHELEKGGLRATLMNAVRAAADKSKKLGASS